MKRRQLRACVALHHRSKLIFPPECPLCGDPDTIIAKAHGHWRVECEACGAAGPEANTDLDAVRGWKGVM